MTKKEYTVVKSVKLDGEELGPGDPVSLEPGQAAALLGTFVEEKEKDKGKAATPTKGKAADGL